MATSTAPLSSQPSLVMAAPSKSHTTDLSSESLPPPLLHQGPPLRAASSAHVSNSLGSSSPLHTSLPVSVPSHGTSSHTVISMSAPLSHASPAASHTITYVGMPSLSPVIRPIVPTSTAVASQPSISSSVRSTMSVQPQSNVDATSGSKSSKEGLPHTSENRQSVANPAVVNSSNERAAVPPIMAAKPPIMAAKHHPRPKVHSYLSTPLTSLIASSKKPAVIDPTKLMKLPAPPCSREKLEFMGSLGLITVDTWKELKNRRQVRKRRNVAPFSVDLAEKEARRLRELKELRDAQRLEKRGRGRPPVRQLQAQSTASSTPTSLLSSPRPHPVARNGVRPTLAPSKTTSDSSSQTDNEPHCERRRRLLVVSGGSHDDRCATCGEDGELLMCDTCTQVFHLACLTPPLPSPPKSLWICSRCQGESRSLEPHSWPGTLSLVKAYLTHHDAQERERAELADRLRKKKAERIQLQVALRDVSEAVKVQLEQRGALQEENASLQSALDHLNAFVRLFKS